MKKKEGKLLNLNILIYIRENRISLWSMCFDEQQQDLR